METLHRSAHETLRARSDGELTGALARLEARWGSAAIRLGSGGRPGPGSRPSLGAPPRQGGPFASGSGRPLGVIEGALALAEPELAEPKLAEPQRLPGILPVAGGPALDVRSDEVVSTGFPALDAILGTGGLPRQVSAAFRGGMSSGKTTLALRLLAEAQAQGAIAAWLDPGWSFDPLEAAARGVDLRWLVVLRPADPGEGFRLAGALLAGRAVDLLVVDLPPRLKQGDEPLLRRLAAHARRLGIRLVVLEPVTLSPSLHGTLAELTGLRLELERRGWIRLGQDVVGQRTAVTVAKNRFGAPGRQVELAIHYRAEGEQGTDLVRLLDHGPPLASTEAPLTPPTDRSRTTAHASPPPHLATSAPPPRSRPSAVAAGPDRAGRTALGTRYGGGRYARRDAPGRAARTIAGDRP